MKTTIILICMVLLEFNAWSKNPIIPDSGVNDPHIKIYNNKAYLYATHDRSIKNEAFAMDDWWIWSSDDLVNWKLESVLKPEDTYIGKPFNQCWATDAAYKNGHYYWYFSEGNEQTGVVVGNSPTGPWTDPLGKPFLAEDLTPTDEYDIAVFREDDGEHYAVFGVWDFYIARMNEDMISLAEDPIKIIIEDPVGPYGVDSTDDKPYLHKYKDTYYLSWGAFYATSKNIYGPYKYIGTVMNDGSFAPGYAEPTWPHGPLQGRHGSFFEWKNQWYFAYCDMSQTGNRRFRDTFISYVHYRENGEIAPVRVDGIGVGQYDASKGIIEAEDYFESKGTNKREIPGGGFAVENIDSSNYLIYPNIEGIKPGSIMVMNIAAGKKTRIEVRKNNPQGDLLASSTFYGEDPEIFRSICIDTIKMSAKESICLVFKGEGKNLCRLDSFSFQ